MTTAVIFILIFILKIMNEIKYSDGLIIIKETLDRGLKKLENTGARLKSIEETVESLLNSNLEDATFDRGSFVKEGLVNIPKEGFYLTHLSPVILNTRNLRAAVKANYNGEEFVPSNLELDDARKYGIRVTSPLIPLNQFGENIGQFLFGKNAILFAKYLRSKGYDRVNLILPDKSDFPFAKQIYFYRQGLDCNMDLDFPMNIAGQIPKKLLRKNRRYNLELV